MKNKKADNNVQGIIDMKRLALAKERDKDKVPLRIDSKTIIYVKPENATKEYAEQFLGKCNKVNTTYVIR